MHQHATEEIFGIEKQSSGSATDVGGGLVGQKRTSSQAGTRKATLDSEVSQTTPLALEISAHGDLGKTILVKTTTTGPSTKRRKVEISHSDDEDDQDEDDLSGSFDSSDDSGRHASNQQ